MYQRETVVLVAKMLGHTCVVCVNTSKKDPSASFHHFPGQNDARRAQWLHLFGMDDGQMKSQSRVRSWYMVEILPRSPYRLAHKRRFASPIKKELPRAKRAKLRENNQAFLAVRNSVTPPVRLSLFGFSLVQRSILTLRPPL